MLAKISAGPGFIFLHGRYFHHVYVVEVCVDERRNLQSFTVSTVKYEKYVTHFKVLLV